jgi:hypothetical protein
MRFGYAIDVVDDLTGDLTERTTEEVMAAFDAASGSHVDIVAWSPDEGAVGAQRNTPETSR